VNNVIVIEGIRQYPCTYIYIYIDTIPLPDVSPIVNVCISTDLLSSDQIAVFTTDR